MGRFIIGDVQGCFQTLRRLLPRLENECESGELWLAGDLVNRGPDSLAVLRWAIEHNIRCVLGNHDLYCLALMAGVARPKSHTLEQVLGADDRQSLEDWLRQQSMLIEDGAEVMVHAGFHPSWSLAHAHSLSRQIESCLQGPDWRDFLSAVFHGSTDPLIAAVNCLTRIRMVTEHDEPDPHFSGVPEAAPPGLVPWYTRSIALTAERTVYFGHWAALGHRQLPYAISLDGGCVWGRHLVAVKAGSFESYREPAAPGDPCV